MKLSDLTNHAGEWLRGSGPMSEIVISSRIRLARNVNGIPFLTRASRQQKQQLEARSREVLLSAQISVKTLYVDLEHAPEIDRQLLVERHLISKQHAAAEGARGVAVGENETISVMINEEDHLRIQVLRSGLQLDEAWEQINAIDDASAQIAAVNRFFDELSTHGDRLTYLSNEAPIERARRIVPRNFGTQEAQAA